MLNGNAQELILQPTSCNREVDESQEATNVRCDMHLGRSCQQVKLKSITVLHRSTITDLNDPFVSFVSNLFSQNGVQERFNVIHVGDDKFFAKS